MQGDGGRVGTRCGFDPTPRETATMAVAAGTSAAAQRALLVHPKLGARARCRCRFVASKPVGEASSSGTKLATRSPGTGRGARKSARRPMATASASKSRHARQPARW